MNGQRQTVRAVVQQYDDIWDPAGDERDEDDENRLHLTNSLHHCHVTGFRCVLLIKPTQIIIISLLWMMTAMTIMNTETNVQSNLATGCIAAAQPARGNPIVSSQSVGMSSPSKVTLPWGCGPYLIHGFLMAQVCHSTGVSIGSAIFAKLTVVPNAHTHTNDDPCDICNSRMHQAMHCVEAMQPNNNNNNGKLHLSKKPIIIP